MEKDTKSTVSSRRAKAIAKAKEALADAIAAQEAAKVAQRIAREGVIIGRVSH